MYQKALGYVPGNDRLEERILDLEWCLKKGIPFEAGGGKKEGKKGKASRRDDGGDDEAMDVDNKKRRRETWEEEGQPQDGRRKRGKV